MTNAEERGSGFLCLENDDAAAERFAALLAEAGIEPDRMIPWNAYPWYINRKPNAAELTYYGLYALQHRGQESAGIVTSDGKQFREFKGMGLVSQVFNGDILHDLVGQMAVGHTRYSTTGSSALRNAQPLTGNCFRGQIAVAHNGDEPGNLARAKLGQGDESRSREFSSQHATMQHFGQRLIASAVMGWKRSNSCPHASHLYS